MTINPTVEMVLIVFARMDKMARRNLIEALKKAKVKLDFIYPNGMPEPSQEPPK